MPGLANDFRQRVKDALLLAETGEVARAESSPGSQTRKNLHHTRIEYLYELAFLRVFVAWESFLEQAFLRYLCGYTSVAAGSAVVTPGMSHSATLAQAEASMLGGRDYVLWHNPTRVVSRSQQFFQSSPIETVINSSSARLESMAAIRHRIAHSQDDARRKFDIAVMAVAGRRYRGARAGSFLRDVVPSTQPPERWIEVLGHELQGLAQQIA